MGLIRWLKKEIDVTNFPRRQSAPPKPVKSFDPNKSRDEAYVRAMSKFIEWRNNERKRRTSEADSQRAHRYPAEDSCSLHDHEPSASGGSASPIDDLLAFTNSNLHTRGSADSTAVQQQAAASKQRLGMPRQHSLPSNMSKNYIAKAYKRKKKGPAPQPIADPNIIHEDELMEFEGYHCHAGLGDNGSQTNALSPPLKFYKQNSNPYPLFAGDNENAAAYGLNAASDAKRPSATLQKCPAKPKRLLLNPQNMQKNTKELAEAHFQGTYQNYEVHSPYYEGRTRDFGMATVVGTDARSNRNDHSDSGRYSPQYQAIVNKHGEIVEYAIPFCEQLKRDSQLEYAPHRASLDVDGYPDEDKCESVINQNFRFLNVEKFGEAELGNRSSLYSKRPRKASEQILITDLDKSLDSSKTLDDKRQSHDIFDELNSLAKWGGDLSRFADNKSKSQQELVELFDAVKASMPCCRVNELKTRVTVLQNTYPSPVELGSGIFRKTKVILRNHSSGEGGAKAEQMALAAVAIKRDLEILRHIRHRNIIMLMAVSFDMDQRQIALVMEPADCTLHYFLYQMKEKSTLLDSISIVQQIASAALYLHECGFIHSNISSHCILMSKSPNYVKLSSFELATSVSGTIQKEIETKYRRHSKRADDNQTNTPIYALLMRNNDKMLKEHYRNVTEQLSRDTAIAHAYSTQCLSDIDTTVLPYYLEYRRQLSVYNYQAPELLTTADRFVFPSRRSDVYSLTLLLWELLNHSVPYVIFNEGELKRLYRENKAELPTFEKERCACFKQIFKYGTAVDPVNRSVTVQHFISLLEDIKFDIDAHTGDNAGGGNGSRLRSLDVPLCAGDEANDEKMASIYENTNDIINDIDAQVISPMLLNEANRYFMPSPKNAKESPKANNGADGHVLSPLHNITSSTSYRSVMDFQKLLSPHRNSTMKRRPKQKISPYCGESFKLNENISQSDGFDQFEQQQQQPIDASIIGPVTVREGQLPSRKSIQHQQNKFMDQILGDDKENNSMNASKMSGRNEPIIITVTPKKPRTGVPSSSNENPTNIQIFLNNSMNSQATAAEPVDALDMQIARKNQIRRNAWLSADPDVDRFFVAPPPQMSSESASPHSSPPESIRNAIIKMNDNNKITVSSSADDSSSAATDETMPLNKNVNVSIRIVRKQLTPEKIDITARSNATDHNLSTFDNEDSPSVMSRIKFWNSLECPIITPKQTTKPNLSLNQSTRLPELVERSADHSSLSTKQPPPPPQPTKHRALLQEINDISEEITRSMDASPLSKLYWAKQDRNALANSIKPFEISYTEMPPPLNDLNNSLQPPVKPIESLSGSARLEKGIQEKEKELLMQREHVSLITSKLQDKTIDKDVLQSLIAAQRRNSVLETVYRIENGLNVNNSPLNSPMKKIENKLFNEKINNTDLNVTESEEPLKYIEDVPLKLIEEVSAHDRENGPLTTHAADDVREIEGRIICVGDVENDANNVSKVEPPKMEIIEANETHKEIQSPMIDSQGKKTNKTMIKRTFYRESIITGSGVETPELERMLDTQTTVLSHSASKSKLTTRVTLNLRNFKRHSSDFGLTKLDADELGQSPRMTDVRHSICGNELVVASRDANPANATSGRSLGQLLNASGALRTASCTCVPNSVSQLSMNFSTRTNRNKDIQSIEDLYIDDDFCQGLCLAANMKLVTNSSETLAMENIDFDVVSTRIYEQANESLNGDFDELEADTKND